MDYDAIAAHFLTPPPVPAPTPRLPDTPARRLRDAVEAVATIGWWSRQSAAETTALGMGFFEGYVWGRAAALGDDANPAAVAAAFGVFEPTMLSGVLYAAKAFANHDQILSARQRGATAGLVAVTPGVAADVIDEFADVLLEAVGNLDLTARPLFAGLRSLTPPTTPHGRAWRAAELVREHRGDGHLAASIAAGLDPVEMNVLTELWLGYPVGEYSMTRGFSADRIQQAAESLGRRGWLGPAGGLTSSGRSGREAIEAATDASQAPLVDVLGGRLDRVVELGRQLSTSVLEHHAAPADARKRAAG